MLRIATAAAALLATAPVALAQDADSPAVGTEGVGTESVGYFEVEDGRKAVPGLNLTVRQIEDLDVVSADGDRLGDVDEVLATADGDVVAISIDMNGVLGWGDEEVILPLDRIELFEGDLRTALTEDEIEALPRWN